VAKVTIRAKIGRDMIRSQGVTIKEWAKRHGFPERAVRAVLSGHNKGNFGHSHRIAVALGIKKVAE
jgi:gp16 family phage-associated protein